MYLWVRMYVIRSMHVKCLVISESISHFFKGSDSFLASAIEEGYPCAVSFLIMCFQRRALYLYLFERNAILSGGPEELHQFLATTFGEDHPSIKATLQNLQKILLRKLRVRWKTCSRNKLKGVCLVWTIFVFDIHLKRS